MLELTIMRENVGGKVKKEEYCISGKWGGNKINVHAILRADLERGLLTRGHLHSCILDTRPPSHKVS